MKKPETAATDDGREDQNPWSKWFWADYEADTGLRASSLCAQGLWMRMLGIMARSKKRGFLLDGEKQMQSKILAKLVGENEAVVDDLIAELEAHGVPSRIEDGTLYNRRMVREAELSRIRSEVGRMGGRPKKQNESKTKANPKQDVKAPSASAYASDSDSEDKGGVGEKPRAEIPAIIERWNGFARAHRLPTILGIPSGSAREKSLLARLEEPLWDFEKILEAIAHQPFLLGDNTQGFVVDFEFMLKPSRYLKILEGSYRDGICGRARDRQPDDPHIGASRRKPA